MAEQYSFMSNAIWIVVDNTAELLDAGVGAQTDVQESLNNLMI